MTNEKTKDGLPVVQEKTFMDFLSEYDITSPNNNPTLTKLIEAENPQIYRILRLGKENAANNAAAVYYEAGIQITYELLRKQSIADKVK